MLDKLAIAVPLELFSYQQFHHYLLPNINYYPIHHYLDRGVAIACNRYSNCLEIGAGKNLEAHT